jgi:hypothetical protein
MKMADDPSKRGSPDNKLISLKEEWEVDYWTQRLGKQLGRKVSRDELREVVSKVGVSARKVRAYLKVNLSAEGDSNGQSSES